MVESIGTKPVATDRSVTRAAAPAPAPAPVAAISAPPAAAAVAQAGSLAQSLAAAPPVDLDRVARVKQALADGTFPILPGTIADNMLAMRLMWDAEGTE